MQGSTLSNVASTSTSAELVGLMQKVPPQVLSAYRNGDLENLTFYLWTNKFQTPVKPLLREFYRKCHEEKAKKDGDDNFQIDRVDIPIPIKTGKIDENKLQDRVLREVYLKIKREPKYSFDYDELFEVSSKTKEQIQRYIENQRAKEKKIKTQGGTFTLSEENKEIIISFINVWSTKLGELCRGMLDNTNFDAKMSAAIDYVEDIDEFSMNDQEKLLQVLVAYRKDDLPEMKKLIDSYSFPLGNQKALRKLYKQCCQRLAKKINNVKPIYPASIKRNKPLSVEAYTALEDAIRKHQENKNFKPDYANLVKLTKNDKKTIQRFFHKPSDRVMWLNEADRTIRSTKILKNQTVEDVQNKIALMNAKKNRHGQEETDMESSIDDSESSSSSDSEEESDDDRQLGSTPTLQKKQLVVPGSGTFLKDARKKFLDEKPDREELEKWRENQMDSEERDQENEEFDGKRKVAPMNEIVENNQFFEEEDEGQASSRTKKVTVERRRNSRNLNRINYYEREDSQVPIPKRQPTLPKRQPKSSKKRTLPKETRNNIVEEENQENQTFSNDSSVLPQIDECRFEQEMEVDCEIEFGNWTNFSQYAPIVEQEVNMVSPTSNREAVEQVHQPVAKRVKLSHENESLNGTRNNFVEEDNQENLTFPSASSFLPEIDQGHIEDEVEVLGETIYNLPIVKKEVIVVATVKQGVVTERGYVPEPKRVTDRKERISLFDAIINGDEEEAKKIKKEVKEEINETESTESSRESAPAPQIHEVPAAAGSVTTGNVDEVKNEVLEQSLSTEMEKVDDEDVIIELQIIKNFKKSPVEQLVKQEEEDNIAIESNVNNASAHAAGPLTVAQNGGTGRVNNKTTTRNQQMRSEIASHSLSEIVSQEERSQRNGRLEERAIVAGSQIGNVEAVSVVEANNQSANHASPRRGNFKKWTIAEMGEWIVEAADWEEGKEVFIQHQINGGNMRSLIKPDFLKSLSIALGPMGRVKLAAHAMLKDTTFHASPRRHNFKKWTIAEMAEWIVEAADWEEGKEVFLSHQMKGGNMLSLVDPDFLDCMDIALGPMDRVKMAAQAMLDSAKNISN